MDSTIKNACPDGDSPGEAVGETLSSPGSINDEATTKVSCKEGDVQVEAGGTEGTITGVTICRFEVARGMEGGGVPEAASQVSEEGKVWPERGNVAHEQRIVENGAQRIVERVLGSLEVATHFVDAAACCCFFLHLLFHTSDQLVVF